MRVAVIGGGISGLTAAFYLQDSCQVFLIEKERQLGGKMQTLHQDGLVLEKGPDSFLARKHAMLNLIDDLKLRDQLVPTSASAKQVYIAGSKQLHPFPSGLKLAIPSQWKSIVTTNLLNPFEKIRALSDYLLPAGTFYTSQEDISLGHFLQRRFGKAYVERICEPILAGIYAGNLYDLSVKATFPQFLEMERRYGSLIRAANAAEQKQVVNEHSPYPNSMFLALRNGFSQLTERLQERLQETTIMSGSGVKSIVKIHDISAIYRLYMDDGSSLDVDYVIAAIPDHQFLRMIPDIELQYNWSATEHISVANVIFVFEPDRTNKYRTGSGFLVPRSLQRLTTAVTWSSFKWNHVSTNDKIVIRAYVGRSGQTSWQQYDDQQLIIEVLNELRMWMPLSNSPIQSFVNRWPSSMPQYKVGHLEKTEALKQILDEHYPGIYVIGASYYGVGLPDCVRHAKEIAHTIRK